MKRFTPHLAALCLALAATPALAANSPDNGQKVTVQVDPAFKKEEAAYKDAFKALTPDQQAALKSIEADYMKTSEASLQVVMLSVTLDRCKTMAGSGIAKNPARYDAALATARARLQAAQESDRLNLHDTRVAKISFIDQKLLGDHLAYMAQLTEGMGKGLVETAAKTGAVSTADCAKLAASLDGTDSGDNQPSGVSDVDQIRKAAEAGDPEAMMAYGVRQISGEGVPKDFEKGKALLTKAAEQGYDRAQYMLGLILASDVFGGTPDKEKAKYWLRKAAEQGNKKAADMIAQVDAAKPPEKIEDLRKHAEAGDAEAEYELGARYAQGWGGVVKDMDEGRKWMTKSAEKGNPLAQSDLAVMLFNMDRTGEAINWMTKAANNGVANSQFQLAGIYLEGKVIAKDEDKALYWYKKAADAGDTRAVKILKQLGKL